ncbi:MAG: hypothetical protein QM299_03670 [Pseudomonadota bacterium]|nr:hypothetical protein [Pseudomonadota bacterium]
MEHFIDLPERLVKREPALWVKRVVIFSRRTREPEIIRDISLQRGLNIIWAEELDDGPGKEEITGHSAGKTTFCRLLRYLLGEENFGRKDVVNRIKRVFPEGYVAAELNVLDPRTGDRRQWAVMRPIGRNRFSYVRENSSVEILLNNLTGRVSQAQYIEKLGFHDLTNQIQVDKIITTDEDIQWGHLLAWCTRDQECRFQNVHEWRSPRSEHGTPSFKQPKEGPLFVMRAALGLFLPDELKGEKNLASMLGKRDCIEKEVERLKQKPRLKKDLCRDEVRALLSDIQPKMPLDDCPDWKQDGVLLDESLESWVEKACSNLQREIDESGRAIRSMQYKLDNNRICIKQLEQELRLIESIWCLQSDALSELDAGISEREEQRNLIAKFSEASCLMAGVLYKDCIHIQEAQELLDMEKFKDARALAENKERFEQKRLQAENRKRVLLQELDKLRHDGVLLERQRNELETKRNQKLDIFHRLKQNWKAFVKWHAVVENAEGNEELKKEMKDLSALHDGIEDTKKELEALIQKHEHCREHLTQTFSSCVRSVLRSERYDGLFSLKNRELNFQISKGFAMNGEAVETLSVLLSDLSCLIFNTMSKNSLLPGIMLHDSPREADLGMRIYSSYIRFVAELHVMLGGKDHCPFQYILTTTTAPPKEVAENPNRFVRLRLNASHEEELLLKRNIFHQRNEQGTINAFSLPER